MNAQGQEQQGRILIVDDEPNVRLVFREALTNSGYLVATADDGEAGLTLTEESPFDLILLDLQMPVLGGMGVLQRLRDRGHNIPVVIVTAHGSIPDVVQAMRLGAIDFVSKPLTPEALRKAVSSVLARHAKVSPEPAERGPITPASEFARLLNRAKKAINLRAFSEAEVFLKEAIALDPQSAEAQNLMGVVHETFHRHDDAYRSYKAAIRADRNFEPAKNNMTRYYERFTFGRSDLPVDTGAV